MIIYLWLVTLVAFLNSSALKINILIPITSCSYRTKAKSKRVFLGGHGDILEEFCYSTKKWNKEGWSLLCKCEGGYSYMVIGSSKDMSYYYQAPPNGAWAPQFILVNKRQNVEFVWLKESNYSIK